jgi:branched-chain amino acid transport system substrate-binding protein
MLVGISRGAHAYEIWVANQRTDKVQTIDGAVALGTQTRAGQNAIKIGVQLPLTGERAPVGHIVKNSVELAVRDVNRKGGVGGVPLAVNYEDDHNTELGAVEAIRKLVRDPQVVAVIGELFSPFVIASRELVEQEGVPYLTGGTSPRTTENAKWIFRVGASDALLTDLLARYGVEHLKLKNLAVLSDRTGIHNARAEMLVKVLREKYGIAPSVRGTWKPGDRDFAAQLEQVKAGGVQVVIALGETAEAASFLRQVKALGIQVPIIAHRDFNARTVLNEAGDAAEGVLIFTEYMPALQEPDRQAWARGYEERYGAEANVIAAQYFDAVLLLAEAVKKGGPSRAGIKAGLEHLKGFRGVTADYTFDQKRNGIHRFYVAKIKEGKPALEAVFQGN